MKIEISVNNQEARDIIKAYALKEIPYDVSGRKVSMIESYGSYEVTIEEISDDKATKEEDA